MQPTTQLTSWDEADTAIRALGELNIKIDRLTGDATIQINQIKESLKKETEELAKEAKKLEKAITDFAERHKADFAKKRSIELTFGTVGYRLVRNVSLPRDKDRTAALLGTLRSFELFDCIKTEEKPDKDKIAALSDDTIVKLGLKRTIKDSFRIQPDIEKITGADQ